ncbi:hypothetical protein B0H17DRAFT_1147694 [Mycena rosella]|uniref:Uncharacterized protein n=1 Tax=Mycena rosella TaxID=1033263 RepID=A0AAD7CHR3_MYCRO|nr:hypothetical protein B0H17DRAFT_1147694 [Mycena rosella]
MHLKPFIFLAPFSALVAPGYAYNSTTFPLYKNSHFGPCPTTQPLSATTPVPDKHPYALHTNGSLSASAFCDRFWNYTVVPSAPTPGAFGMTWVNSLMNTVSAVATVASMFHALTRLKGEVAKSGLFSRSFFLIAKDYHTRTPHPILSPMAVTTVWAYFVTFDLKAAQAVVWVLAVGQYFISLAALVLCSNTETADQYMISTAFNTTAYTNCTGPISALLHDPTNTPDITGAEATPLWFFFAWFPLVLYYSLKGPKKGAEVNAGIAIIVAIISLLYSLPVTASRATSPIAWDPGCGLVHVMMGSGYGYWDVKGEEDWNEATSLWLRVVSGILTVYF